MRTWILIFGAHIKIQGHPWTGQTGGCSELTTSQPKQTVSPRFNKKEPVSKSKVESDRGRHLRSPSGLCMCSLHTCTYTHTCAHTYMHVHTYIPSCIHVHAHINTHACTHKHMHAHINTHMHAHTYMPYAYTHKHRHACAHTCKHMHTNVCIHIYSVQKAPM